MSDAHYHLLINHLPTAGLIFGLLILLVGTVLKKSQVRQTGLLVIFIAGVGAIPTSLTGHEAEEVVEKIPGISHHLIHDHEELAEVFEKAMLALAIVAMTAFILDYLKKPTAKWLIFVVLFAGISTVWFGKQVGESGGKIRHETEMKGDSEVETEP